MQNYCVTFIGEPANTKKRGRIAMHPLCSLQSMIDYARLGFNVAHSLTGGMMPREIISSRITWR